MNTSRQVELSDEEIKKIELSLGRNDVMVLMASHIKYKECMLPMLLSLLIDSSISYTHMYAPGRLILDNRFNCVQ